MYCECIWQEIDYRNRLIMAGCNPDCLCNDCLDNTPVFRIHSDCE